MKIALKPLPLFGLALIAAFAIFGFSGLRGSVTPYVDIATAQATTDRVQVKGKFDKSTLHNGPRGELIFNLVDFKTAQQFAVVYSGPQPANMQMARDVVAMGSWDAQRNVFAADQMNIKCPDKYAPGAGTQPSGVQPASAKTPAPKTAVVRTASPNV